MQTSTLDRHISGEVGLVAAGETGLPTTSLGELPAPTPPRYNLFTAAEIIPDNDPHWQSGKTLRAYPEPVLEPWTIETGGASKPAFGEFRHVVTKGFTVIGRWQCDSAGIISPEEFSTRARQAFLAWEVTAVEKQLWTNVLGLDPFLSLAQEASADADPSGDTLTILGAGATLPLGALALLEDHVGGIPIGGVLHMRPDVATLLGFNYLKPEGQTLRTILGTEAVIGVGYPGTGKDGAAAAAAQSWVFATGPVQVRRSDLVAFDRAPDALNRETNDWTVMYERNYLVSFDPLIHAAVLVDLSKGLGG